MFDTNSEYLQLPPCVDLRGDDEKNLNVFIEARRRLAQETLKASEKTTQSRREYEAARKRAFAR